MVPEAGRIIMPDNQIDKPRLDLPTSLINSSATWLSAHVQKINRPCLRSNRCNVHAHLKDTPIFYFCIAKPDNGGSEVLTHLAKIMCFNACAEDWLMWSTKTFRTHLGKTTCFNASALDWLSVTRLYLVHNFVNLDLLPAFFVYYGSKNQYTAIFLQENG